MSVMIAMMPIFVGMACVIATIVARQRSQIRAARIEAYRASPESHILRLQGED
jgi:hypothetical protein